MESNIVDPQESQDHKECVVSSSDVEPPFQDKSAAGMATADERSVNVGGGVRSLRPGSLTLIENLERSRRAETTAKSTVKGFVVETKTDLRPTTTVRSSILIAVIFTSRLILKFGDYYY